MIDPAFSFGDVAARYELGEVRAGTAEAVPLPDRSVAAVFCGRGLGSAKCPRGVSAALDRLVDPSPPERKYRSFAWRDALAGAPFEELRAEVVPNGGEIGREALIARIGDAVRLHWLAAERPYELYWRGAWDDVLEAVEDVLQETEAGYGEHAGKSVRAWIRLARGDLAGALEDSAGALDFARRAKDPAALCQALALRSRVLAEAGRADEASPVVDEAVGLALGSGTLASTAASARTRTCAPPRSCWPRRPEGG